MAVVQFIVEKDRSITNESMLEDPGNGVREEILRVVGLMNTEGIIWQLGYKENLPVRV